MGGWLYFVSLPFVKTFRSCHISRQRHMLKWIWHKLWLDGQDSIWALIKQTGSINSIVRMSGRRGRGKEERYIVQLYDISWRVYLHFCIGYSALDPYTHLIYPNFNRQSITFQPCCIMSSLNVPSCVFVCKH